ncbi:MAG: hypothetical protein GX117_11900 [Candidatus Hydrogenedentes bacterium]|nr:hypothetical protein [Candidatus Hydrogenedentota bacterium]
MKGLSFENFIKHPSNQKAFDICSQLARFEGERRSPVVLLGEKGAGKSHLLWGLVNYYRSNKTRVGVALISPTNFPAKIKKLAVDPAKLTTSRPIVILVDDLNLFSEEDLDDLEKVLYVVDEHGHTIVLTTQIHPNIMTGLSGKLKSFLSGGLIIGLKALPKSEDTLIPEAALQEIMKLKQKIAELEEERSLDVVAGDGASAAPDKAADGPSEEELAAWEQEVNELTARFEKQKQQAEEQFGTLAAAVDQLEQEISADFDLKAAISLINEKHNQECTEELKAAKQMIVVKEVEIRVLRTSMAELAKDAEKLAKTSRAKKLFKDPKATLGLIVDQLQILGRDPADPTKEDLPPLQDTLESSSDAFGPEPDGIDFLTTPNFEGDHDL